jgi:hypothetical protein
LKGLSGSFRPEEVLAGCARVGDAPAALAGRLLAVEGQRLARSRLSDLFDIGIDEVSSWKRQHNYLTLVADHRRGKIVWGCGGAGEKAADRFFTERIELAGFVRFGGANGWRR